MKLETKFNVGDTVYFLVNNVLYKGVINEINIKVSYIQSVQIPWSDLQEIYEVNYINRMSEEVKKDIAFDSLFKSTSDLFNKLMSDFKNANNENE